MQRRSSAAVSSQARDTARVGYGISFAVKKITIYKEETSEDNPFGEASDFACGTEASKSQSCKATMPCAQKFLDRLSKGKNLFQPKSSPNPLDFEDVCLAHAFSNRDFCFGILGLAWVGTENPKGPGICAEGSGKGEHLNTGISTTRNFGQIVSRQVSVITLAHEMGHNFGSGHDSPNMKQDSLSCTPGTDGEPGGNYIMYYKATDGDEDHNDEFSPCSMDVITKTIVKRAPACFKNIPYKVCGQQVIVARTDSLCGNGEIGPDEDCDCGSTDPVKCAEKDPCCTTNCTLTVTSKCSDKKGKCCKNCQMVGLEMEKLHDIFTSKEIKNKDLGGVDKLLTTTYGKDQAVICEDVRKLDEEFEEGKDGEKCFANRYCIKDPIFKGACPPQDFVYDESKASIFAYVCLGFPLYHPVWQYVVACIRPITLVMQLYQCRPVPSRRSASITAARWTALRINRLPVATLGKATSNRARKQTPRPGATCSTRVRRKSATTEKTFAASVVALARCAAPGHQPTYPGRCPPKI